MAAQEVHGDPVQPGPRIGPGHVVRGSSAKRNNEGLRREVVRKRGSDAPAQEPMDGAVVAVEDEREGSAVDQRALDELRIRHRPSFTRSPTDG
jgi:hypothetical protein